MSQPAGVIHDLGYQRYTGPRLGRWHVVGALYLHGLRAAFGLGRSAKAKVFPWLIAGLVGMVAAVLTAVQTRTDRALVSYTEFPEILTIPIVFFCAIVAPELVSRDLHSGVLPLYFARPLRRQDYALARLAALVSATFLVLAGPLTLMFAGAAFSAPRLRVVWDEFADYLLGLGYVAVHAVVFAVLALLVASLLRRRAVAAGAVVGSFLLTTPVVAVLSALPYERANQLAGLASPVSLVGGVGDWVFEPGGEVDVAGYGPLYGLAALGFVVAGVLLLLARYRKVASK
jgi:ABC-2 type transport system permease protein